MQPESIDLADVANQLARTFSGNLPTGYLPGKTVFRDAVTDALGCSLLEAEEIIDTLIVRGFLKYEGVTANAVDDPRAWRIVESPGSLTSMLS